MVVDLHRGVEWREHHPRAGNILPGAHVWTDASGRFGCGAVPETEARLQLQWPKSYSPEHLVLSEERALL